MVFRSCGEGESPGEIFKITKVWITLEVNYQTPWGWSPGPDFLKEFPRWCWSVVQTESLAVRCGRTNPRGGGEACCSHRTEEVKRG